MLEILHLRNLKELLYNIIGHQKLVYLDIDLPKEFVQIFRFKDWPTGQYRLLFRHTVEVKRSHQFSPKGLASTSLAYARTQ